MPLLQSAAFGKSGGSPSFDKTENLDGEGGYTVRFSILVQLPGSQPLILGSFSAFP